MNDLEEILQQYGSDRRQQQDAAERLRGLARRQRRLLATVASIAVILVSSVWTALHLTTQPTMGDVIVARQSSTTPRHEAQQPTISNNDEAAAKEMPVSVKANNTPVQETPIETEIRPVIIEEPLITHHTDPQPPADSSDVTMVEQSTPTAPYLVQLSPLDIEIPEWDAGGSPAKSDKRIDFTASVGASAMSSFGPGYVGGVNQVGINEVTSFAAITPHNSFSASVGMNYTVVKQERFASRIGVVVSGHAQRGDIVIYDVGESSLAGIDGFTTSQLDAYVDETRPYSSFSLYAGIPLAIEVQPLGNDKAGWSFSLTPAHALFAPEPLGGIHSSLFVPNPWKLTLGVGVFFPRRFPRSIGLNVNLLSASTSSSIHEIGIEIGF